MSELVLVETPFCETNLRMDEFINTLVKASGTKLCYKGLNRNNYGVDTFVYTIDGSDSQKRLLIRKLYEHRFMPIEGFDDILDHDFHVRVFDPANKSLSQYANELRLDIIEEASNMQGFSMEGFINDQEECINQLQQFEAHFNRSGMVNFKPIIQAIFSLLEQDGMLKNRSELEKYLFETLH